MSQKALEDLLRQYPTNLHEMRGKKLGLASFQETHPTHELAIHESLEVMDDAEEEIVTTEPESGQRQVKEFFRFLA